MFTPFDTYVVQPHYGHFAEVVCFDIFWYDSNGFLRHVVTTVNRHANTSDRDVTEGVDVLQLNEVFSKLHHASPKNVYIRSAIFYDFFLKVKT